MMLIDCPFCGPRDETEFSCGGEAHIARPLAENKISDAEFADYLFMRDNPKGLFLERWRHSAGCRRWFNMARDTVSHDIVEIYPMAPCQKQPRQNLPIARVGAAILSPNMPPSQLLPARKTSAKPKEPSDV